MKNVKHVGTAAIVLAAVLGLLVAGCVGGGNGGKIDNGNGVKVDKGNGGKVDKGDGGTGRAPSSDVFVALRISLPAPMFKGTPKPVRGEPNMGPARNGRRPPFLAPKGTVNLAKGKPVTSSDPEPIIGDLKFATDGEKAGGDGCVVWLAPGKQWLKIDLQQQAAIYAITIWHYHQQGRAYRDVVVQVGKDEDFIEYKTVFNNDHDNSSGQGKGKDKVYMEDYQGKLIDCKGVQGRYVRLWSRGNTTDESSHYIEVEVYGRPANPSPPGHRRTYTRNQISYQLSSTPSQHTTATAERGSQIGTPKQAPGKPNLRSPKTKASRKWLTL